MILTKVAKSLEKAGVDEESASYIVENLNHRDLHDRDVTEIKSQLGKVEDRLDKLEDRLSKMEVNNERRFAEIGSALKFNNILITTIGAPIVIGMLILLFNLFLNK